MHGDRHAHAFSDCLALSSRHASAASASVPAATAGPELRFETIHFDWSMQCYRPENGSLFVFVEDTENQMVALRFYDFLNNGGPATGGTIDLANHRLPALRQ